MSSLASRSAMHLQGSLNDKLEAAVEYLEQRGRNSTTTQKVLVWLRERIAGYSSVLSWYEIEVCVKAIVCYLGERDRQLSPVESEAHFLFPNLSDEQWKQVVERVDREIRYLQALANAKQHSAHGRT